MKSAKTFRFCPLLFALLCFNLHLSAQYPLKIHSHNDYTRIVPFYEAYAQKIYSIEVDMYYIDDTFYVCHDKKDINPDKTFESLYLKPLQFLYHVNNGQPWADSSRRLQLMLEIKSNNTDDYLNALTHKYLQKYPEIFDPAHNPNAVRIVITGHVPSPAEFSRYPEYILFDGDLNLEYTPEQLSRVGLFSMNFKSLSSWNGKGSLTLSDKKKVLNAIKKAHDLGKEIRFWGAPDNINTWNTFHNLNIDYINTDHVTNCTQFFSDWHNKTYVIADHLSSDSTSTITHTKLLDKTTHDFTGFRNDKLQLTERTHLYKASYWNDGADKPVKNVILLIGDGMGLAQVSAADRINNGLNILLMKFLGLISTSSLDAFTTDSAGAGSALSTGRPTANRHICANDSGEIYPQITDFFRRLGKDCGVVTLGNIADATPACFYGHNKERDNAEELTHELLNGKLTVLTGSGIKNFTDRLDGVNMIAELREKGYRFLRDVDSLHPKMGKVICIDEEMSLPTENDNLDLLARSTRNAIELLNQHNPNGFFLMVEGAKIDYAGHSNCFPASIVETLGFDQAVGEALKFADSNGETLVIVTGDHETGGLTLIDGNNETGGITAYYTTDDHTPIMLPVYAYGPQAHKLIGKYRNYELPLKIMQIMQGN